MLGYTTNGEFNFTVQDPAFLNNSPHEVAFAIQGEIPNGGCYEIQNTKLQKLGDLRNFASGRMDFQSRSKCICRGMISWSSVEFFGSVVIAKARSKAMVSASKPTTQVSRKLFRKN